MKFTFLYILLLPFTFSLYAQDSNEEIIAKVKENYVILKDGFNMKDFDHGLTGLKWFEDNYATLEAIPEVKDKYLLNVFKYGSAIAQNKYAMAHKAKDEAGKLMWQDKILELYVRQLEGGFDKVDTVDIYSKMGKLYYPYMKDREGVTKESLMEYYDKNIAITKDQTDNSTLTYYMVLITNLSVTGRNAEARKDNKEIAIIKAKNAQDAAAEAAAQKELDDYVNSEDYKVASVYSTDWVLDRYERIMEIIDLNVENATDEKEVADWEKTRETIDGFLLKAVDIDEKFIEDNYTDIIQNKPSDLEGNKKAIKLFLIAKGTSNPLFMQAVENVFATEPNAGMAKLVYRNAMREKDWDKAVRFVNEAIKLDEDPNDLAEYYLHLSKIQAGQAKYSSARSSALKAVEYDSKHMADAYRTIGNLYMQSFQQCAGGDVVQDAGFALAAYDAYARAGYSKGMNNAKKYFPTVADIFSNDKYKEGDDLKVGCWINVSTKIRTR